MISLVASEVMTLCKFDGNMQTFVQETPAGRNVIFGNEAAADEEASGD